MFIDVKPLLNHIDDGEQGQPARGVVGTSGHPGVVAFDVSKWAQPSRDAIQVEPLGVHSVGSTADTEGMLLQSFLARLC